VNRAATLPLLLLGGWGSGREGQRRASTRPSARACGSPADHVDSGRSCASFVHRAPVDELMAGWAEWHFEWAAASLPSE
jgi:hypothetical protein